MFIAYIADANDSKRKEGLNMSLDCRNEALRFVEIKERSTFEVKSHLVSKGFSSEEIETELNYLVEMHYLDDERYCSNYIQYGLGKGRGPVRLQQELSEKGIDSALIREMLEESFDRRAEREAALAEAKKLIRQKQVSFGGFPDDFGGSMDSSSDGEADEDDSEEKSEGPDEKMLARIGRKLNTLGYHSDVIYEVIRKLKKS